MAEYQFEFARDAWPGKAGPMSIAGIHWPSPLPKILWMGRSCPRCSSVEFRSAELEPLDVFFAVLSLHPVRCVNCWRRYYWFRYVKANQEEQFLQGQSAVQAASTKGKSR